MTFVLVTLLPRPGRSRVIKKSSRRQVGHPCYKRTKYSVGTDKKWRYSWSHYSRTRMHV